MFARFDDCMVCVDFSEATFRAPHSVAPQPRVGDDLLSCLVYRPTIFQRRGIRWIATHAWRTGSKERGIAALRRVKAVPDPAFISSTAEPIAALIRQLGGCIPAHAVTSVPCGHSRRSDCFGKRLALGVAAALGIPFIQTFADRPVNGVSHPRRSALLPPLQQVGTPARSMIVVDDVSTSGKHLEEILLALRHLGASASAFAWISGSRAEGRPAAEGLPAGQEPLHLIPGE